MYTSNVKNYSNSWFQMFSQVFVHGKISTQKFPQNLTFFRNLLQALIC